MAGAGGSMAGAGGSMAGAGGSMAGAGGDGSCSLPGALTGTCTAANGSSCIAFHVGSNAAWEAIQSTCTGTASVSACVTSGQFLGCCVLPNQNVKNCFYGAESLKASFAASCASTSGSFCSQ